MENGSQQFSRRSSISIMQLLEVPSVDANACTAAETAHELMNGERRRACVATMVTSNLLKVQSQAIVLHEHLFSAKAIAL